MKMKKRILSALLLAVMCMSLLAGCGGGGGTSGNSSSGKETGKKPKYTLEETMIVDNECYSVSVVGVSTNEDNDCVIEFSFTNKTEAELLMNVDDEYVNGYETYFMWSDDESGLLAGPGETVAGKGYVPSYMIGESGKEAVEELEAIVVAWFSNEEDRFNGFEETATAKALQEIDVNSRRFAIYPTGLDADTIEYEEPEEVEGEQVLEDNEYFTYVIQSFEKNEDEKDSYYLDTYVENKMDERIVINWEDVRINGKEVELYQYTGLSGGKRALGFNYIMGELTEGFPTGEDIEEITFTLRAYENGDTTSAPIYEADFTYKVQ